MKLTAWALGACLGGAVATSVMWWSVMATDSAARGSQDMTPRVADEGRLTGLWRAVPTADARPDLSRFWYFHGDGKGLYRYGTTALNNTHSFDYRFVGDTLELRFRKTGEQVRVKVHLEETADGPCMLLDPDPEDPGARYRLERGPVMHAGEGPSASGNDGIDGRLWMDLQPFATGGMGFRMYQLNAAAIDGRGIGWFHEGDFDQWSTEALSYRLTGDVLRLHFTQRDEHATVHVTVAGEGEARVLTVRDDPRDFYKDHGYRDVGESFGRFGGFDAARVLTIPTAAGADTP